MPRRPRSRPWLPLVCSALLPAAPAAAEPAAPADRGFWSELGVDRSRRLAPTPAPPALWAHRPDPAPGSRWLPLEPEAAPEPPETPEPDPVVWLPAGSTARASPPPAAPRPAPGVDRPRWTLTPASAPPAASPARSFSPAGGARMTNPGGHRLPEEPAGAAGGGVVFWN